MASVASAAGDTITVPGPYPTIQAALDGAPAGSVIQLSPGVYHERLLIGPQHAVTLRGDPDDPSSVVLDASGGGDVIRMIDVGSDMVVEGLTLTGGTGNSGYGGGLFMATSHAVFRRCVFRGNVAANDGGGACLLDSGGLFQECVFENNTAGVYGGGVMANDGTTTAFDGCTFVGNRAGTGGGPLGSGGGVHVNDSSPTFVGCTFQGNSGKTSGGGILVLGHFDVPESVVSIENCTIADNVAFRDPSGASADGGGLHVEDNAQVTLRRCVVRGNVANNGGGVHSYRATLELRDSLVEGNEARLEAGFGGYGGGVAGQSVNVAPPTRQPATIRLTRTVVRDNTATIAGGAFMQGDFLSGATRGVLEVTDSLIARNTATVQGGGLKVDHADLTMQRGQVLLNRVLDGGLTFGGGLVSAAGSVSHIENSTFAGNRTGPDGIGGGIYADQGGRLEVTGSRFVGNEGSSSATLGGGAIAIGQSAGPVPGPIAGAVTDSVIADNGSSHEIFEFDCDPSYWSAVEYRNNDIHSDAGRVYYRNCSGGSATVAAFNGLSGKAGGNSSTRPSFVEFTSTPSSIVTGGTSVLTWIVPGGFALDVDHGVGEAMGAFGLVDVTPPETTTYTLSASDDPIATTAVEVVCASLGGPIPRSPVNRNARQAPGHVTLEWFAAVGASTYDVYLDAGTEPATLVAQGVTTTSTVVTGLSPTTTYRWRVMANSPACGEPVAGPIFEFTTCANDECAFVDTFDDGDASDWSPFGRGTSRVESGLLQMKARKRFGMVAPAQAIGDGVAEVRAALGRGHRNLSIFFGWRDDRNYGELVVSGGRRWKLRGRVNGKLVRGASARQKVAPGTSFVVGLARSGTTITVTRDGMTVLTSDLPGVGEGAVAIGSAFSVVAIDEVRVAATPGS
ncbi:MAG TPA: right-handed parallel beta-helix repeat-containing protein [Candidatus Binatia bacterium]|nr:right-handed parallel beta-helix repeat-containing protein [Candidatus Binatia bacterium]